MRLGTSADDRYGQSRYSESGSYSVIAGYWMNGSRFLDFGSNDLEHRTIWNDSFLGPPTKVQQCLLLMSIVHINAAEDFPLAGKIP